MSAVLTASAQSHGVSGSKEVSEPAAQQVASRLWLHLADGRRVEISEVTESGNGIWYRRGNVSTFLDRAQVTRIEREDLTVSVAGPPAPSTPAVGKWTLADAIKVETFFTLKFKRRLPVTAFGQSDLHDRWGYNHRNSMDIGVHPDSSEGQALIEFLRAEGIPFRSFRGAIPGVASGPHVHVGHPSPRLGVR